MKHREGVIHNMHKPFLARQMALISGWKKDRSWTAPCQDGLAAYFTRYEADYFNTHCGLYVWADDVMIGMDNDPATFGRPRFSTANLFLNCFMVPELRAGASLFAAWGDTAHAAALREKTGTLHEYYNPFTGEPVMNGDFVNWNVLALNMADELRGKQPVEDLN